ncbi:MAG: hypothetical protein JO227_10745 [Acetobacteraceae bacterium]|nr:hypothetical protein [Acetobacteraceae bacterium]
MFGSMSPDGGLGFQLMAYRLDDTFEALRRSRESSGIEHAYDQLLGLHNALVNRYNALLAEAQQIEQTVQHQNARMAELDQQLRKKEEVIDRLTRSSDEDFDRTLSLLEELDGLRKEVERLRSQQG